MNPEIKETPWYWEVTIECAVDCFEIVSYFLFEAGAEGVEELNQSETLITAKVFFLSSIPDPALLLEKLQAEHADAMGNLSSLAIEKKEVEDWQSNWKIHFKPLAVGKSFCIRPPWEACDPDKKEIVIYPGQGFGTGYHESTNLALQMLEWLRERISFEKVIDAGTGSGILAIGALLLQAKQVIAFDIEEEAIKEVPKNLVHSSLDPDLCRAFVAAPNELEEQAPLVLANINGFILEKFADDLMGLTETGGYLLLSGIIDEEKESLMEALNQEMSLVHSLYLNDWNCLLYQKK
ncbi:MAG: hypothetical protein COB67_00805 [SAR324 cluster bacterium]|uniref:Ribosomal protein L11 methyltransferase n=1 Tax=SAR324 cluster bacterium TaxID=2024889 RepID=A0A2A4TB15_9DELT|nr:MAG: hypothetical protein COB67_00805 [SAR324 cluster bacterium]